VVTAVAFNLPERAFGLVEERALIQREELADRWAQARRSEPLSKIYPMPICWFLILRGGVRWLGALRQSVRNYANVMEAQLPATTVVFFQERPDQRPSLVG
jgi:hypothetical protein